MSDMKKVPKIFDDKGKGMLKNHTVLKYCNHDSTSQIVLHNHPNKESLIVCKSCFRTVDKDSKPKRVCSTSMGRRKNRSKFRPIRMLQNNNQDAMRPINTARHTLRTRNRLRETFKTECCPERTERIKFTTQLLKSHIADPSVNSSTYDEKVDFRLFKLVYDNLKARSAGRAENMNFCPNHPNKIIEYICCTEKVGICSSCLHSKCDKNTKVISIPETMRSIQEMLLRIEKDSIRIIHNKNEYLKEIENQGEFIEQTKEAFIREQKSKINELHEYLDKRLAYIISQYNERIEQQLLQVYNTKEALSKEIEESL